MTQHFEDFLQALISNDKPLCERPFFEQGSVHLEQQLRHYLSSEGIGENTFEKSIEAAQKLSNIDTNKRFWSALKVFNAAAGNYFFAENTSSNKKWLRFINIIESLQGYNGSQIFAGVGIKKSRLYRLYFAYMLTWEHLRYLAGDDDDFTPSAQIMDRYADYEHDHHHE
ncbi:hypothetical protein [Psychromonas antarctica]|uniref:hypothetical protein n=1 Tax=Psychromonas antarctica TaxID=67573 RepID=UPI001EE8C96B|nr:hypothetical protein [Psychromonas antarctica]MCG6200896.1 hypothetical protein [Psychromonas antarctica]